MTLHVYGFSFAHAYLNERSLRGKRENRCKETIEWNALREEGIMWRKWGQNSYYLIIYLLFTCIIRTQALSFFLTHAHNHTCYMIYVRIRIHTHASCLYACVAQVIRWVNVRVYVFLQIEWNAFLSMSNTFRETLLLLFTHRQYGNAAICNLNSNWMCQAISAF